MSPAEQSEAARLLEPVETTPSFAAAVLQLLVRSERSLCSPVQEACEESAR